MAASLATSPLCLCLGHPPSPPSRNHPANEAYTIYIAPPSDRWDGVEICDFLWIHCRYGLTFNIIVFLKRKYLLRRYVFMHRLPKKKKLEVLNKRGPLKKSICTYVKRKTYAPGRQELISSSSKKKNFSANECTIAS